MKKCMVPLYIIFLCIVSVSGETNNGLYSQEILRTDLDLFIGNTSDTSPNTGIDHTVETGDQIMNEWIQVGKTQLQSGNYAEAGEAFSKVLEDDPFNNNGRQGYLLSIRESGDYNSLLAVSENLADQDPSYDPAWYYQGIALDNLKRYNESVSAYDEALKLNPYYAKAWNNKGVALHLLGRYDEAVASFEKALEIVPAYTTAHENIQASQEEQKNQTRYSGSVPADPLKQIISVGNTSESSSMAGPGTGINLTVTGIDPDSCNDCQSFWNHVWVTITGTGFGPGVGKNSGMSVNITRAGQQPQKGWDLNVKNDTTLICNFDAYYSVTTSPGGIGEPWDVVVSREDGQSASLLNGIRIDRGRPIFDNMNLLPVSNNPEKFPQFDNENIGVIKYIETYHWNDGKGSPPGTIALQQSNGKIIGPWEATGFPKGDVPDVYWRASVDSVILTYDNYTIIDSNPETWSHNDRSDNTGFALVRGCE
jgi:tetratricopeptide (TPR) repeat protein